MKKHVTIKDVARDAGVSVATVSYVVNNRTDMRISEKTRKKVLQVINLLGYTPNQSAQALVTSRKKVIALYLAPGMPVLKNAEQLYLIDFLASFLHEKNYNLIYLSSACTEKFDQADAIVCYDMQTDDFHQIGDVNFRPLLALDCFINDPLFYQVNTDYERIAREAEQFFQGADYTLFSLPTPNLEKQAVLNEAFRSIRYITDFSDLYGCRNENILVTDQTLYRMMTGQHCAPPASLCHIPTVNTRKAQALFECIEYAMERISMEQHNILI